MHEGVFHMFNEIVQLKQIKGLEIGGTGSCFRFQNDAYHAQQEQCCASGDYETTEEALAMTRSSEYSAEYSSGFIQPESNS